MEIILLEKINNLGSLGDRIKVKPGYARNFLIPKGKATTATAANIARFEARRASWSGLPRNTCPGPRPAPSNWRS